MNHILNGPTNQKTNFAKIPYDEYKFMPEHGLESKLSLSNKQLSNFLKEKQVDLMSKEKFINGAWFY